MSEKRFRVRFEQEDGRGEIVNEKGVELTAREVVDLLNHLHQENQQLTKSRDYWSKKTKEFSYYFNCLEKAIEKTFDSDDQCFEEIWKYYDKMEKKWEYD